MPAQWEPGTQYNYDDVVEYQGHRYKIIQPHRSQSDWTPPATPALWGRLSDDDGKYGGDSNQQRQQQQQQQGQYDQQSQNQQQPSNDEEKKHWYQDEETRKKLEIGGGLVAGAAVLAGGLFGFKKHEEHKQQVQNEAWARNNWLNDARERSRSNVGYQAANWVLTTAQHIPRGAILVGREKTWNLYICRSFYDGGVQLGKASEAFQHGGVLGCDNKEVFVNEYEVLVGDMNQLIWVQAHGTLNVRSLGYRPVEGGNDTKGLLYIAEAPYKDAVHPGKAAEHLDGAYITYGGDEKCIKEYRVLCYRS